MKVKIVIVIRFSPEGVKPEYQRTVPPPTDLN